MGNDLLQDSLEIPAAYELSVLEKTDNLRQHIQNLARNGAEEGTIVWAKKQNDFSGYFGENWICNEDDFYCGLILQPEFQRDRYAEINFVAALALGNAIAAYLSPMTALAFHWPNRLMIANHRIAGIWLDAGQDNQDQPYLTVTASCNVRYSPDDFQLPAMSIHEAEGGTELNAETLFCEFSREFVKQINSWDDKGFEHTFRQWKNRAEGIDQKINLATQDNAAARLIQFTPQGGIEVELPEQGRIGINVMDQLQLSD